MFPARQINPAYPGAGLLADKLDYSLADALFKRKLVSDPQNYRAINLTTQVSKVVERVLCPWIAQRLERFAFGDAQFAYGKKCGARDAAL